MRPINLIAIAGLVISTGPALAVGRSGAATAELHDASGAPRGTAVARSARDGIEIEATITGVPAGTYAIHVHPIGKCEGPDFASAGTHWNPMNREHGSMSANGPHLGDLPNVVVKANGRGHVVGHLKGASLRNGPNALLDADGSSILLHINADDYKSQPSGNSGAKIACGVFSG